MKKRLYIIGICGTAMAAIARLARDLGWQVAGADAHAYPPMSDYLRHQGIAVHQGYAAEHLTPAPDLVVIGNAIGRGNAEAEAVLDRGLPFTSGAQFVGDHVLPGRHAWVVAGTHGKTTTASLLAHVLDCAGRRPGFMIGGIAENFAGGARLGEGVDFILEGDEYDTAFFDKRAKFLHYHARTLILNNLEYDHADIYPDIEAIKTQFHHLVRTVPRCGRIIVNADDGHLNDVLTRGCWTPLTQFGAYGTKAEWQWQALRPDGSRFRLMRQGRPLIEAAWDMVGVHHVANACAVAAAASSLGVDAETMATAFASFKGVRRRMTWIGEARGVRVFEDFAHHPTAIRNIITAASHRFDKARLWAVVEPRSNTMRGRTHQDVLPGCFAGTAKVVFVPPASRGLPPDELLDVQAVCAAIGDKARVLADAEAVVACLTRELEAGDVVLILSNGDFAGLPARLLAALQDGG